MVDTASVDEVRLVPVEEILDDGDGDDADEDLGRAVRRLVRAAWGDRSRSIAPAAEASPPAALARTILESAPCLAAASAPSCRWDVPLLGLVDGALV